MAKVSVTFELDYYEDKSLLSDLLMLGEATHALWDLDQKIRTKLKHGEDSWLDSPAYEFLEEIRGDIHESGVFRNYQ